MLHMSSLVFVGKFPENLLDERELFDGRIDPGGQLQVGSVKQCAYANGVYQYQALPERIDLRAKSPNIMPNILVEAVEFVVKQLDAATRSVDVFGFGMNCDTTIDKNLINRSGRDYCFRLLLGSKLKKISDEKIENSFTRLQFTKDAVRYDIRLEPHLPSQGENLFVAANGHQNVSPQDSLREKLQHIDSFRGYVGELHQRIIKEGG